MKPVTVTCKICGNKRPGVCVNTLFGLNVQEDKETVIIHGDLRKVVK